MFCEKCGSTLSEGARFCTKCGEKVDGFDDPASTHGSTNNAPISANGITLNFAAGAARLGNSKTLFFVNIALFVLSFIFGNLDVFEAELLGVSGAVPLFSPINTTFLLFWIAVYAASVVCLLIPVLSEKVWNKWFFLPAKITGILSACWFLLVWFVGNEETSSQSVLGLRAKFGPTAAGWLFIIATIGAIVLTFKLSKDILNPAPTTSETVNA